MPALLAWLLALLAGALPAAAPVLSARVTVFQPACSQAQREDVAAALAQASGLLAQGCGIKLSLTAWTALPLDHALCDLPDAPKARALALKRLSRGLKAADPGALALVLLPSRADERLSWALVDVSAARGCDSPQEARYLDRFGSIFATDLAWGLNPRLLLAHEALHALTQRGHPNGAPRGHVMADHLADMGPAIDADWCACARRSPYLEGHVQPPSGR